jgi:hypothetical protein
MRLDMQLYTELCGRNFVFREVSPFAVEAARVVIPLVPVSDLVSVSVLACVWACRRLCLFHSCTRKLYRASYKRYDNLTPPEQLTQ